MHLAVLEALGELDEQEGDEFSWDDIRWVSARGTISQ